VISHNQLGFQTEDETLKSIYNQLENGGGKKPTVRDNAKWLELRSRIYLRDKAICWVCNEFVALTDYDLGHLVARSNGGKDDYDNLVVMHTKCNLHYPRNTNLSDAISQKLIPQNVSLPPLPSIRTNGNAIQNQSISYKQSNVKPIINLIVNNDYKIKQIKRKHQVSKPKSLPQFKLDKIIPLTVTWIQGKARWFIPPRTDGTYHKEDKFACGSNIIIAGCTKTGDRYSSPYDTIEIIGEDEQHKFSEAILEFGISIARISRINGELKMEIYNDKTKANIVGINKYSNTTKQTKRHNELIMELLQKGVLIEN
jgi:hypothetical protein